MGAQEGTGGLWGPTAERSAAEWRQLPLWDAQQTPPAAELLSECVVAIVSLSASPPPPPSCLQDGWRPRVYKTHFWHLHCPKGAGRYLFITRDPLDAGPSFYHFLQVGLPCRRVAVSACPRGW